MTLIEDEHYGVPSFVVGVVEPPVVVVVGWRPVHREVILDHSLVVSVRHVVVAHLVPVAKEGVDAIVVLQELGNARSVGIHFILTFVDPVILIAQEVLWGF